MAAHLQNSWLVERIGTLVTSWLVERIGALVTSSELRLMSCFPCCEAQQIDVCLPKSSQGWDGWAIGAIWNFHPEEESIRWPLQRLWLISSVQFGKPASAHHSMIDVHEGRILRNPDLPPMNFINCHIAWDTRKPSSKHDQTIPHPFFASFHAI